MDYSYVLNKAVPEKEKLLEYGFIEEEDGKLSLKKEIGGGEFYVILILDEKSLTGEVFESSTAEKYGLFDVARARGSFVNGLREEVRQLVEDILKECFEAGDIKEKYEAFLKEKFAVQPDNPFKDSYDYPVYRCPNEKWFALLMNIKFKSLGIQSDETVWVVNLKCSPETISRVTDRKSVFPAYHMNKKYWITVLLTAVTDFNLLCELSEESWKLVEGKN